MKLLCGDSAAESYLGYLTDAAIDLLPENRKIMRTMEGVPWPGARRKLISRMTFKCF